MIFLKQKKELTKLLKTINEMVILLGMKNNANIQMQNLLLQSLTVAINKIDNILQKEKKTYEIFNKDIQSLRNLFNIENGTENLFNKNQLARIQSIVRFIEINVNKNLPDKLNIVFMPYKVTMWDSLASIYEEAKNDPNCVVKVVPIPYYELTGKEEIYTYEGDLFPKDIKITSYNEYNLEEESPDIIYIHNAYDAYNEVTRVKKEYFTSNLKKYTDMLVFVPYHITGFGKLINDAQYVTYAIPTIKNIDKLVVAGQFVKDAAVKYGIPEEKVLVLGSPKMDAVYQATKDGKKIPEKWKKQLENKFVFALDTNCTYLINNKYSGFAFIQQVFDAARMNPNCAVIWRPHPLSRLTIEHFSPDMLDEYDALVEAIKNNSPEYPNIVYDDGPEYFSFLSASDAYISELNSIMALYTITEQPMILNSVSLGEAILLPDKAFYHFYDASYPWYQIVKDLINGNDKKRKLRKKLASQIYSYTDGTSGKMIHQEIKNEVILNMVGKSK
ncbi:hypothetical protein LB941_05905 [Ligilactobacillus sp. WILCCON 0076]|uniref:CDP-Glycerol:Poly(Glycerophosphate) glycerophosphotransferase n=1 Tax=Ligilactobacillus ubinensis TaxID=2876789 RepID=A0A9X2JLE0_9LACO|nr:CDP-glycerol glycerophosphotransferase family protein [Ligilactobacillus ubinensis]MCP0886873.1 hypothetical protein [Ligilactobacillus ubinensis]